MKKICKYCGQVYETKSRKSFMCKSKECIRQYDRERLNTENLVCESCGKEFKGKKGQRFCCNSCARKEQYHLIKCVVCGKEFKGKSSSKYCSEECKNKETIITIKCNYCGKEFKGTKDRKYCSLSCASKVGNTKLKEQYKDFYTKRIEDCKKMILSKKMKLEILEVEDAETYKEAIFTVKCKECGEIHEVKGKSAIRDGHYSGCKKCTYKYREKTLECKMCKNKFARLNKEGLCAECNKRIKKERRQKLKRYKKAGKCGNCGRYLIGNSKKKCYICKEEEKEIKRNEEYLKEKICKQCGEIFHSYKSNSKYCSEKCIKKHENHEKQIRRDNRLKENGIVDKTITLEKLYKRDNGTCKICGHKCDYTDYYIDENGTYIAGNNYPSIDHIKPISKGGCHTWENVQLAHRICNTIKNDKVKD